MAIQMDISYWEVLSCAAVNYSITCALSVRSRKLVIGGNLFCVFMDETKSGSTKSSKRTGTRTVTLIETCYCLEITSFCILLIDRIFS